MGGGIKADAGGHLRELIAGLNAGDIFEYRPVYRRYCGVWHSSPALSGSGRVIFMRYGHLEDYIEELAEDVRARLLNEQKELRKIYRGELAVVDLLKADSPEKRERFSAFLGIDYINFLQNEFSRGAPLSREELRAIYTISRSELALDAGKALGYSPLKMWCRERPLKAVIRGIAAAGAATGLTYMLYNYLNR